MSNYFDHLLLAVLLFTSHAYVCRGSNNVISKWIPKTQRCLGKHVYVLSPLKLLLYNSVSTRFRLLVL